MNARELAIREAQLRAKQRAARTQLARSEYLLAPSSPFASDPVEVEAAESERLAALEALADASDRFRELEAGLADADLGALPPELRAELDRMTLP
ncbi:MAG: hypothetical protein HY791_10380 [Deltaproteobacteria bacterium]|nr:hypothetical protein [Deltaproteobacteria bacterium]